ncbi:hypothetical protein Y1Q_0013669 [Alligator mississippiensis]|uniref:Uncharacterized protein n=1 Tax=Alligator mississippiensis TaxID=8496 RepID=A0A151P3T0_ALLMI|nr:hypothetical protein Y1Q_0013669 [Alligator mississippiensis]
MKCYSKLWQTLECLAATSQKSGQPQTAEGLVQCVTRRPSPEEAKDAASQVCAQYWKDGRYHHFESILGQ